MKRGIKAFIELARPLNCAMAAAGVIAGEVVSAGFNLSLWQILIAPLVAVFVTGGGNAINDYFDREIDAVSHRERPIPSGRLLCFRALLFSATCFSVGILLTAFFLNSLCLLIVIVNILLLLAYDRSLKKRGVFGNITISYLVASLFIFGGAAVEKLETVMILAVLAFLTNLGREILKDIEDIGGDIKNRKTLPMIIGREKAAIIASISLLVAVILTPLPLMWSIVGWGYLGVVFADIVFLVASTAALENPALSQRLIKTGMFLGILAFLFGGIT